MIKDLSHNKYAPNWQTVLSFWKTHHWNRYMVNTQKYPVQSFFFCPKYFTFLQDGKIAYKREKASKILSSAVLKYEKIVIENWLQKRNLWKIFHAITFSKIKERQKSQQNQYTRSQSVISCDQKFDVPSMDIVLAILQMLTSFFPPVLKKNQGVKNFTLGAH